MKFVVLLLLFVSCNESLKQEKRPLKQDQTKEGNVDSGKSEFSPYVFDTLLSGGYHLSFEVNKEKRKRQSLSLMYGNRTIRKLNQQGLGGLHKNLGYIGADLGDYFVFSQSFGAGNPTKIQLIEKKTGREIRRGYWVGVDTNELIVLYFKERRDESDRLYLYDLKNDKEQLITDFDSCRCVEKVIFGLRACVQIERVTKDSVVLSVEYEGEKIQKKYKR